MGHLSFSKLDLADHCSYPWTGGLAAHQRPSADREFGSTVSQVAECLATWGDAPYEAIAAASSLSLAEARTLRAVGLRVLELLDSDDARWRRTETAFALDLGHGTARALGTRGRDYSGATETEIPGSSDLEFDGVARDNGAIIFRGLVVRDYKTGRYAVGKQPRRSGQMRALALAAARTYGADEVCVQLAQVDEDGVRCRSDVLTAWDLDVTLDWLRSVHERTRRSHDVPCPGAWCRDKFCPVLASCPATRAHEAALLGAGAPAWPLVPDLVSPEHAAYVRERARALGEAVQQLEHAVELFAATTPIPLANGKVLRLVEQHRDSIDLGVAGALDVLRAHLGDRSSEAIESKTSKSAVYSVAKEVAPKRGATGLCERIYDDLRAAGAMKTSTFTKLTEVDNG